MGVRHLRREHSVDILSEINDIVLGRNAAHRLTHACNGFVELNQVSFVTCEHGRVSIKTSMDGCNSLPVLNVGRIKVVQGRHYIPALDDYVTHVVIAHELRAIDHMNQQGRGCDYAGCIEKLSVLPLRKIPPLRTQVKLSCLVNVADNPADKFLTKILLLQFGAF